MADETKNLSETVHVIANADLALYDHHRNREVAGEPPFVSLYLPLHHNDREQRRDEWDATELKDLSEAAKRTFETTYSGKRDYSGILERLAYLQDHPDIGAWKKPAKGLAIFISNDETDLIPLDVEVEPTVQVADTYYLKPLLRNQNATRRYFIIALSNDRFGFIEGTDNTLRRVPLPAGSHDEFSETYATYDGVESALDYYSLEGHFSPYHMFRSRNDVEQAEGEKFFRYVNHIVDNDFCHEDSTPVILASLPEHQAVFRRLSTLHNLLDEGIEKDPGSLTGRELLQDAVAIMNKHWDAEIEKAIEHYRYEKSKGKASDDLKAIAEALVERKVDTLFVQQGKGLPGSFNPWNGEVFVALESDPTDNKCDDPAAPDLVDAFAHAAILQDATIYVLPAEIMPSTTGVAATYRY